MVLDDPPPQEIICPDAGNCPVTNHLPELRFQTVSAGRKWFRVYDAKWGYDEHNRGFGNTRFAPIDDPVAGVRLPSMYLGATQAAVLLETVFRGVGEQEPRVIYQRQLRGQLMAHVEVPAPVALADLRNPELRRMGIERRQIVSSDEEHYPCTRRLAIAALGQSGGQTAAGLIWHSRQAELNGLPPEEVVVLYGTPRFNSERGLWGWFGPGALSLYDGPGRLIVDEVAERIGAVVEDEGD